MAKWVLDASAVLALINNEPGASVVEQHTFTDECYCSAVNLAEVLAKLSDYGLSVVDAHACLAPLQLIWVAVDEDLALASAHLREPTKKFGLSLGDRACLALAQSLKAPVLTADKPWLLVAQAINLKITCIR